MSTVSNHKHIFGVLFVARLLGGLVFLFGEDFFVSFLCLSFLFEVFLDRLSACLLWAKTRPLFHF